MKNQQGMTLVEVLSALAILGIVGAGFLWGMTDITKTTPRVDDKSTALSIAESQIEYIRNQNWQDADAGGAEVYDLIDTPYGFNIQSPTALPMETGLQKLRVQVWVPDSDGSRKILVTLEEYRAQ